MYEKQGGHVRNKQIKFHIFIEFGCSDMYFFNIWNNIKIIVEIEDSKET